MTTLLKKRNFSKTYKSKSNIQFGFDRTNKVLTFKYLFWNRKGHKDTVSFKNFDNISKDP